MASPISAPAAAFENLSLLPPSFMEYPAEIRIMIYECVLEETPATYPKPVTAAEIAQYDTSRMQKCLALAQVSHQIRQEFLPMFKEQSKRTNTFRWTGLHYEVILCEFGSLPRQLTLNIHDEGAREKYVVDLFGLLSLGRRDTAFQCTITSSALDGLDLSDPQIASKCSDSQWTQLARLYLIQGLFAKTTTKPTDDDADDANSWYNYFGREVSGLRVVINYADSDMTYGLEVVVNRESTLWWMITNSREAILAKYLWLETSDLPGSAGWNTIKFIGTQ